MSMHSSSAFIWSLHIQVETIFKCLYFLNIRFLRTRSDKVEIPSLEIFERQHDMVDRNGSSVMLMTTDMFQLWLPQSSNLTYRVNLKLRILLILEGLLHTLIFSSILTHMDDFTQKSILNGTISTFQLSISHFSAVTYPLSLRMVFTYLN